MLSIRCCGWSDGCYEFRSSFDFILKFYSIHKNGRITKKIPFHCIIAGPTNCGKTKFLIDQLRGPFRYTFEYIVLICPTYPYNKTYSGFAKNDPRFFVLCPDGNDVDEIDSLLTCCEEAFATTNTLIILDDCAVSKDLKKRSNKFINLAFSGRHINISIWVLTQQLTSISKPFRDNIACVISFHNPSGVGMKALFDDFGGDLTLEEKKSFCKILKTEPFSKLCFCLCYPFISYVSIPSPVNLVKDK